MLTLFPFHVAVATASICLRGRGFESSWGHVCFFFLARRGLYGGMRMGFAGRENEKDRTKNGNEKT